MITLQGISKSYGARILFKDISLTIGRGEKVALIGPNGAGKSTLFHIILNDLSPSDGTIQMNKNLRIGYLPQESSFQSDRTVLGEIMEGDPAIIKLKKEKDELEARNETATRHYGDIQHRLEALGFFELEYKGKQVLSGLGFKERDFVRPIQQMSGGWQMRVLLGKLLTCHYDLLLLDEPTNYLDLNAAVWFKDYLANYKGTFVMISHDKVFLNEVTNYSLILENGMLAKIKGNYDDYDKLRQERKEYLSRQFRQQEKTVEQYQRFIDRFHAQPNKASQVRAKKKMLERMEKVTVPSDPRESIRKFHFPLTTESGYRVVALEAAAKAYGDIQVYQGLDFEIIKGEKAVLAGENGAGKSTLLKILAGVVSLDSGQLKLGHNVQTGYFSQTRTDVLCPERTVMEEAFSVAQERMTSETLRTILAAFLFTGDDIEKKVSILSGGEKSRLILAKLLINPPNCLLLDEPTTHLDVDAVEALIKALQEYKGTVVFISHDIYFVKSIANNVFEVKNGHVTKFPGNFDYYLHKKAKDEMNLGASHTTTHVSARTKSNVAAEAPSVEGMGSEERNKFHNAAISKQIKKLRKQKEKLETERYAKSRITSNPRHGEEIIRYYSGIIEDLDKQINEIEGQISELKKKFIE